MDNCEDVNWDEYAECYDVLSLLGPYQELQDCVARHLQLTNGLNVLEAGCGTGNLPLRTNRDGLLAGVEWHAVDCSAAMLRKAKAKLHDCDIRFAISDLNEKISYRDNSFDRVVCVNALYALENPLKSLFEFYRVLRPKGRLLLANPNKGYQNGLILKEHCGNAGPIEPWLDAHATPEKEQLLINLSTDDEKLRSAFLSVAIINRRIWRAKQFHFYDPQGLASLVRQCGFKILKIESVYASQGTLIVASKEEAIIQP